MTLSESFNTCLREKYATFSGRASRSEYWWFFLIYMVLMIAGGAIIGGIAGATGAGFDANGGPPAVLIIFGLLFAVLFIGLLIPATAVAVRRFHDRGLSGWWYLAAVLGGMLPLVGWLISIATLVIMCLRGEDGPNKFGPDPLKPGGADVFA